MLSSFFAEPLSQGFEAAEQQSGDGRLRRL
jgi:hypothetical protein